jgi:hypothetical protein
LPSKCEALSSNPVLPKIIITILIIKLHYHPSKRHKKVATILEKIFAVLTARREDAIYMEH